MDDENILKEILSSDNLPSLPAVASRLLTLIAEEDSSLTDIAELVSMDIGLSSKILKVVNSAFYGLPNPVGSISQAVSMLGSNAIQNLVLSCSFFNMKGHDETKFDFEKFWENSFARAVAAKFINQQLAAPESENIFVCGLLQNLGKLIFACTLSENYDKVVEILKDDENGNEDRTVELDCFGVDHSIVSAKIAEHWGFPNNLIQPLKYHHTPHAYLEEDEEMIRNIRACYLSDLLVKIYQSNNPEQYHSQFRTDAKQLLGLSVLDVNAILKNVHKQIDQTANCFGLNREMSKSVEEILQEANLRLSFLNMSYEEMNRRLIDSQMNMERLTKELQEKNKLLENLAFVDGLTNVHNHRYFQTFLDQEINRARRSEGAISVLMADIDHFKHFNDTYGHQAGDFILQEFCRIAEEQIRTYDLLARYGGEEFVLVLPEIGLQDARDVAERIRYKIANHLFEDRGKEHSVTVSIGVASASPSEDIFNKNELIRLADEAMYRAKEDGRNRVVVFEPGKKKGWFKF